MEGCPNQLLDLIAKDREWLVQRRDEQKSHGSSEEKKLELRLGPPGEEDWTKNESRVREESVLSLGYLPNISGSKRGFKDTVDIKIEDNGHCWIMNNNGSQTYKFSLSEKNPVGTPLSSSSPWSSSVVKPKSLPVRPKEELSQPCSTTKGADSSEKEAFSPASANPAVVPSSSQKRSAAGPPVVGWPPIRSFRKNLASGSSSSSKPTITEPQNEAPVKVKLPVESSNKGYFVKINMDGVPIGRKVDLKAYDSYEKLSSAVDHLFRDLLAAQMDSSAAAATEMEKEEGERVIKGILDGSGDYTLVYEDNEGDRMLVGDVPWHMFVSTVKRLRVLRSSELSKLCFRSKQEKVQLDDVSK